MHDIKQLYMNLLNICADNYANVLFLISQKVLTNVLK